MPRNARIALLSLIAGFSLAPVLPLAAQVAATPLDLVIPPGANFDKAAFRLWLPPGGGAVQAVLVLVPGSNGDGRAQVDDSIWQQFAIRHRLALLGVWLTDNPHEQGFLEDYVQVARGSGPALLDALRGFAVSARHPELAAAPLLLWGMSAGGEFNYEFVNWRPERVVAFVVNKGGIYYTALTSRGARNVPGILFVGGKDLDSRINTIAGLFAVNRRGGALWAFAEEPGAGHIVGRSRDIALLFFEDVLAMRIDSLMPTMLRPVNPLTGFLGDLKLKTFQPIPGPGASTESTAWLPTARVARAWQAMLTGTAMPQ